MKRHIKTAVYIILILLAVVSVIQGAKNALYYSQDFQYDAALALRCGINPYEVSLSETGIMSQGPVAEFYRVFEEAGAPQKMEANQFPSLLMLLFPMTFLPYRAARVLWLILNLLFTAGICLLLRKTFLKDMQKDVFNMMMLLMLAGTPFRNQLGVGQHTLFSFFFFLLAVYLSEREKKVSSALALAVSYFKYTLTAPLAVYFLYKRRFKEFIISLIPHVILTAVGAAMLGKGFIDMIREPLKVSSLLAGEGSIDIGALSEGASISPVFTVIIMLGLVVMAFILPENEDDRFFSLLILLSLIMTYHRIYDFFVLTAASAGTVLMKAGKEGFDLKKLKRPELAKGAMYCLLLLYFYFVLRIFGENRHALMAGAVLYYGYLIVYISFFRRDPSGSGTGGNDAG